jgi:hypothetical protein
MATRDHRSTTIKVYRFRADSGAHWTAVSDDDAFDPEAYAVRDGEDAVTVQTEEVISDASIALVQAIRVKRLEGMSEEELTRRSHGKFDFIIRVDSTRSSSSVFSANVYPIDEALGIIRSLAGLQFRDIAATLRIKGI